MARISVACAVPSLLLLKILLQILFPTFLASLPLQVHVLYAVDCWGLRPTVVYIPFQLVLQTLVLLRYSLRLQLSFLLLSSVDPAAAVAFSVVDVEALRRHFCCWRNYSSVASVPSVLTIIPFANGVFHRFRCPCCSWRPLMLQSSLVALWVLLLSYCCYLFPGVPGFNGLDKVSAVAAVLLLATLLLTSLLLLSSHNNPAASAVASDTVVADVIAAVGFFLDPSCCNGPCCCLRVFCCCFTAVDVLTPLLLFPTLLASLLLLASPVLMASYYGTSLLLIFLFLRIDYFQKQNVFLQAQTRAARGIYFSTGLSFTLLSYIASYWAKLHLFELCRTLLSYIASYWAKLHLFELCCTLLSYAASYQAMLHSTELRRPIWAKLHPLR